MRDSREQVAAPEFRHFDKVIPKRRAMTHGRHLGSGARFPHLRHISAYGILPLGRVSAEQPQIRSGMPPILGNLRLHKVTESRIENIQVIEKCNQFP
jgi:hypothetical protein